ncbi:unnamed protein product, partial [marine sediment metagenome]
YCVQPIDGSLTDTETFIVVEVEILKPKGSADQPKSKDFFLATAPYRYDFQGVVSGIP